MTAVLTRVFPPTGPTILREAAARLVEDRASRTSLDDVRHAIHDVLSEDAIAHGWAAPDELLARLEGEAFDLFEALEADAGWPQFATVVGLSDQIQIVAAVYQRELRDAAGGAR